MLCGMLYVELFGCCGERNSSAAIVFVCACLLSPLPPALKTEAAFLLSGKRRYVIGGRVESMPQICVCQDYIILARHISFEKAKDLSDVFLMVINTFCCIVTTKTRCFFAIHSTYYWIKAGTNIELMIQIFLFYRNQPALLSWLYTGKM